MNLPNKLTLLRIALVPVMILVFMLPFEYSNLFAAVIFIIASITDFLDGYIARSQNLVSDFGKFIDPIADKILVMSALVLLTYSLDLSPIVTIIILAREFIVSGIRLVAAGKGKVVAADMLGKAKTVSQMLTIIILFSSSFLSNFIGESAVDTAGIILTIIATLLTVVSGVNYALKNKEFLLI